MLGGCSGCPAQDCTAHCRDSPAAVGREVVSLCLMCAWHVQHATGTGPCDTMSQTCLLPSPRSGPAVRGRYRGAGAH